MAGDEPSKEQMYIYEDIDKNYPKLRKQLNKLYDSITKIPRVLDDINQVLGEADEKHNTLGDIARYCVKRFEGDGLFSNVYLKNSGADLETIMQSLVINLTIPFTTGYTIALEYRIWKKKKSRSKIGNILLGWTDNIFVSLIDDDTWSAIGADVYDQKMKPFEEKKEKGRVIVYDFKKKKRIN